MRLIRSWTCKYRRGWIIGLPKQRISTACEFVPAVCPLGAVDRNDLALAQDAAAGDDLGKGRQAVGRCGDHHLFQVVTHNGASKPADDRSAVSVRDADAPANSIRETPCWTYGCSALPVRDLKGKAQRDQPSPIRGEVHTDQRLIAWHRPLQIAGLPIPCANQAVGASTDEFVSVGENTSC